jgi:hypothetical protein
MPSGERAVMMADGGFRALALVDRDTTYNSREMTAMLDGCWKYPTVNATEAIWSTPRSADNHARRLVRFVTKHLHDEEG